MFSILIYFKFGKPINKVRCNKKKYSMCFARYNKLLRISNLNVQKVWVQGWNTDSIYTIHNNFYVRKNKKWMIMMGQPIYSSLKWWVILHYYYYFLTTFIHVILACPKDLLLSYLLEKRFFLFFKSIWLLISF